MSTRKFHFKKDEYQKYEKFNVKDENLDHRTSISLDENVVFMIRDLYRFTEKIDLFDQTNNVYATVKGYNAFQKSLVSHLAFIWQKSVPQYPMTMKDMQRSSRKKLMRDRIGDIGMNKTKYAVSFPRYVSGLFEYPVPSIPIFPLSFAVEYSFAKYAMDNRVQFFSDDRDYIEDLLTTKQRILDMAIKTVEDDIIPRL